ncbi:dsRBD fold-containing protein [Isoptericola sp. BMS4]|uniref:dsRBD fold-containing protein n=1 Tax=Isoptericola sp. BMS4 TaxID=2527875 RepID=UPI001422BD04|nr:dsRBD fold-containing protein [Isoptericola sp. BMS4]
MRATVGDRIVVASGVVGGAVREGVVVACPHGDGTPPYQVRWSDTDEESLVFPGSDTLVQREDGPGAEEPTRARSVTWQVQVTLVESAGSTTAEAMLAAGPAASATPGGPADVGTLRAVGHTRRNPDDVEVPLIGDEVAAGRALRRLADALLGQAEQDISAQTGHQAHVHP